MGDVPPAFKAHQFKRGTTGNPAGRPKGLAKLVRETVGDDMPAIIRAQVAIAKGQKPEGYSGAPPKPSDITKAAEWVRDTGWHKPLQRVENHNLDGPAEDEADMTTMTDEQLDEIIAEGEAAQADMVAELESESEQPTEPESDDHSGQQG